MFGHACYFLLVVSSEGNVNGALWLESCLVFVRVRGVLFELAKLPLAMDSLCVPQRV